MVTYRRNVRLELMEKRKGNRRPGRTVRSNEEKVCSK